MRIQQTFFQRLSSGDYRVRFVLICFALLAVAFYQLSGGNDFVPRSAERQAAAQSIAASTPVEPAASTPLDVPVVAVARLSSGTSLAPRPVTVGEDPQPAQLPAQTAAADTPLPEAPARLFGRETDLDQPTVSLASLGQNPEDFAGAIEIVAVSADPTRPLAGTEAATSSSEPAVQPELDIRVVSGSSVNMRSGPGTNFGVLDQLDRGTRVRVIEEDAGGWVRLRPVGGDRVGWMAAYLLSDSDS